MRCHIWLLAGVCLLDSGCSWGGPKEDNFYPLVHRGFDEVDRYGAVRISYHNNPGLGFDFDKNLVVFSSRDASMYFVDLNNMEERIISVSGLSRMRPSISGHLVVSEGYDKIEDPLGIVFYDLVEKKTWFFTQTCADPHYPHIWNEQIVYNAKCPPIDSDDQINIEVFGCILQEKPRRITELRAQQFVKNVYDNWIIWEDYRKGFCKEEIVLYDLNTAQSKQLTDDDITQFSPDVDGDLVVWTDLRNGTTYTNCSYENSDIYLYRISTGELRRLTTDPHDQEYAVVSGKYVAWTDYRYGSRDPSGVPIQSHVFVHNLETGEEKQVTFGEGFVECCPKISGDRLVYLSYATGGWGALWMVDLKKYWPD